MKVFKISYFPEDFLRIGPLDRFLISVVLIAENEEQAKEYLKDYLEKNSERFYSKDENLWEINCLLEETNNPNVVWLEYN